jgi:2-methylisocitrate lyase-like PEP mutase family enzyme
MNKSYREKTSLFRRLHQGPSILVLPNAWDAASAKIFYDSRAEEYEGGGWSIREQLIFLLSIGATRLITNGT